MARKPRIIAPKLNRYTNMPALIHILTEKKLTMLSPSKWDDRNDAYFLEIYKEKRKLRSLLALCFSEANQTYHHWRVFAYGTDGVCIEFNKRRLLESLKVDNRINCRRVSYNFITKAEKDGINTSDLPFVKRRAYKPEKEFRILFEDSDQTLELHDISIPLDSIKKITINPWLPRSLYSALRKTLIKIEGCERLNIIRFTIIENGRWKKIADASV